MTNFVVSNSCCHDTHKKKFLFNGAGRGTVPLVMASLYTKRHIVLVSRSYLANPKPTTALLSASEKHLDFMLGKARSTEWLSDLMISHHVCLRIYHTICLPLWNVTHSGNRSSKTFKPKKNIPEGSHQYELLKHAEATLGSGNLRMAVMLPEGEDLNEWVAVNSKHCHLLPPHPPHLYHSPLWFGFLEELHDFNFCPFLCLFLVFTFAFFPW